MALIEWMIFKEKCWKVFLFSWKKTLFIYFYLNKVSQIESFWIWIWKNLQNHQFIQFCSCKRTIKPCLLCMKKRNHGKMLQIFKETKIFQQINGHYYLLPTLSSNAFGLVSFNPWLSLMNSNLFQILLRLSRPERESHKGAGGRDVIVSSVPTPWSWPRLI